MNRAIFLDRDGTINVEKHYLHKIEDFEFLPGVIEGLKLLQDAGFLLIIVTNQSGIGRGYYSEEDFNVLTKWMIQILEQSGVKITQVYFCPHLPDAIIEKYRKDCDCRKPRLGMYLKAVEDYDIDLSQSYVIGDKIRDGAICNDTECRGFLVADNEKAEIIEDVKSGKYNRVSYQHSLLDCAKMIIEQK